MFTLYEGPKIPQIYFAGCATVVRISRTPSRWLVLRPGMCDFTRTPGRRYPREIFSGSPSSCSRDGFWRSRAIKRFVKIHICILFTPVERACVSVYYYVGSASPRGSSARLSAPQQSLGTITANNNNNRRTYRAHTKTNR